MKNQSPLRYEKPVLTLISLINYYSLGLRTISALLKSHGYRVNLVFWGNYINTDPKVFKDNHIILDLISNLQTDLVGISVNSPFMDMAKEITKSIKQELQIKTIWGGTHPTILPDESILYTDFICRGEGEYACLDLMDCIRKEDSYHSIQNLWVNDKGKIIKNNLRPLLTGEELDLLPFPDYGTDNIYYIDNDGIHEGDPFINSIQYEIIASRGCPHRCTYCVNSILRDIYPKDGKFVRIRSPENVIREIEHALTVFHNVETVRFEDEVFPWNKKWLSEFHDLYKKRINRPFVCTYSPSIVNEHRIALLKDAGLSTIGLGIQSLSERVRKEIFDRPESDEKILAAVKLFHQYNIEVNFDLIFDNHYEDQSDKIEGFNFIIGLPKPFIFSIFSLVFFPEVVLTKKALADNIITEDTIRKYDGFAIQFDWNATRKPEDTFWYCLFILSSRSCFPSTFVKLLRNVMLFRQNPSFLVRLVKVSKYLEFAIMALRRLQRGQIAISTIIKAVTNPKALKKVFS